jgi:hypothetical protein
MLEKHFLTKVIHQFSQIERFDVAISFRSNGMVFAEAYLGLRGFYRSITPIMADKPVGV